MRLQPGLTQYCGMPQPPGRTAGGASGPGRTPGSGGSGAGGASGPGRTSGSGGSGAARGTGGCAADALPLRSPPPGGFIIFCTHGSTSSSSLSAWPPGTAPTKNPTSFAASPPPGQPKPSGKVQLLGGLHHQSSVPQCAATDIRNPRFCACERDDRKHAVEERKAQDLGRRAWERCNHSETMKKPNGTQDNNKHSTLRARCANYCHM